MQINPSIVTSQTCTPQNAVNDNARRKLRLEPSIHCINVVSSACVVWLDVALPRLMRVLVPQFKMSLPLSPFEELLSCRCKIAFDSCFFFFFFFFFHFTFRREWTRALQTSSKFITPLCPLYMEKRHSEISAGRLGRYTWTTASHTSDDMCLSSCEST